LPFSGVPEEACNWEKAMQLADMALYLGKMNGRNRADGLLSLLAPYQQALPELEKDFSAAIKPRNLSWTGSSVRFSAFLARVKLGI
jgi:hypothetical protein